MSDSHPMKQQNAWRSKFRARSHEEAHDQEHDLQPVRCDHQQVYPGKPAMVDTQAALAELIQRLRTAGSFAYDSEFIGELSYVPKLCLIQIATCTEIALVDPLATIDLMPLWELLADPSVEKVVHAGPQDMEPVNRLLGKPAANVIDTQIAAGFAALPYPLSLQRLLLQMLDVRVGKGLTFTHWDQRPLSASQLRYAADDVRYLPAAWMELHKRIESAGTMAQVRQECDAMCTASPYQFDEQTSFMKVRGVGSLDARQLGILRELASWRNAAARAADLPPRTLLRDDILIELARRAPATEERLLNVQSLPRAVRLEHATEIIAAIARGKQNPIDTQGELRKSDEMPEIQFSTDGLVAVAQASCMAAGVDPQLVFTRSDVADMRHALSRNADINALRLMRSWRRSLIGDQLMKLMRDGGDVHLQFPSVRLHSARDAG